MIKNLLALAMVQSLLLADGPAPMQTPTFLPGEPLKNGEVPAGYPIPSQVKLAAGPDIYVTGNFLYWNGSTLDDQVGTKNNADKTRSSRLFFASEYRPGFRVGAGYDANIMLFDFVWTRYHHEMTSHFSAHGTDTLTPNAAIIGEEFSTLPDFKQLKSRWQLHYDDFLITGQKNIFARPKFILNACYGIDGLFMSQHMNIQATTPGTSATGLVKAGHKLWSIGPFIGMRLRALMPWNFRIIGKIDFNLNYSRIYKGNFVLAFPTVPGNTFANNTQKYARPASEYLTKAESGIGIDWNCYLAKDHLRLAIMATYDVVTIFNFGPALYEAFLMGNTYFHGLTLGGRLDF